ncbi:MAG TPA: hypothetical protein VI757_08150 [Bacteroidia bacterium]|nr:hypothetical protein [Bacteroidia bacterium]
MLLKGNLTCLSITLLIALATSADMKAQLVKQTFTEGALAEDFSTDNDLWMTASNTDNFFVIQNGEYILRRKNFLTGYTIFPKWENQLSEYSIAAAIKLLGNSGDEASAGIIFMAQADNRGALMVEFNKMQQFRIRQLAGVNYKLLTGDNKNSGWVPSSFILPGDVYNKIEIRTAEKNYDILLNNNLLASFTELAYKNGRTGIILGASTNADMDYFYVNIPEKKLSVQQKTGTSGSNLKGDEADASETITLTAGNYYYMLSQLEELKKQNDELNEKLNQLNKADTSALVTGDSLSIENVIKIQKAEILRLTAGNDSLHSAILNNPDNDKSETISTLTKALRRERQLTESLTKENKDLKEAIEKFK